jgi:quinol monooxygenase YgiN
MIRTSITFTRPNIDILWHNSPELEIISEELKEYIMILMASETLLYVKSTESDDNLQLTSIGYWKDHASLEEFNQHPSMLDFFKKRDEYYKSVNVHDSVLDVQEVFEINQSDL